VAKRTLDGKRAIVTGASSGIGREIALRLAGAGTRVVLVARRRQRLDELAASIAHRGGHAVVCDGDLTDPAVRSRAVDAVREHFGGLDILVNNAGLGRMGLFERGSPEELRHIMEVNFFALAEMTRLALPLLKEGNDPIIVNISSILGHRGVPHNSEYCASKFAVQGFSESLRAELAGEGIDVLVVSPGTTQTEFFDTALDQSSKPSWPEHKPVTAAEVGRQTVAAIRRGRHEIVPYFWGKVLVGLNRLSPTLTDRLIARYR
jgi:short-subunit dehydrogenase